MFYQKVITVPANTSMVNPVRSSIGLSKGLIRGLVLGFPQGCAGLVHVQLWDKSWQLLPWTPGQDIAWDNRVFEFPSYYPLVVEPYEITATAWNLDDTFQHSILVGVTLDEGEVEIGLVRFMRELQAAAVGPA